MFLTPAFCEIAQEFGVPNAYLPPGRFRTRLEPAAETALVQMLRDAAVELVVLAGFMRVLKEPMLAAFAHRIINIHPSLLPKFPGLEAWKQALAAGETVTGCTVHYVEDGPVDSGEIIAQREVPILPNDTPETLHERIQIAEREFYPAVIARSASKALKALGFLIAREQVFQCFGRISSFVNDPVDLVDDRALDLMLTRAFEGALRGRHAFRHHFRSRGNLLERFATPELLADTPVAAQLAEAGSDEIAGTTQAIKRARLAAHRGAEPNQFR